MKIIKSLAVALLLTTSFVACKKDNTPPPFTIEGKWEGKIGTGNATPSGQYALNIKSGGTIERVNSNGTITASGTWQLAGDNFSATYNYQNGTVVEVVALIDKGSKKLSGSWENNGGEEGSFYANKQ
ncbi:hypothetical protein [Terrimonas alba]|uniref:hypothetical protein n=1 Tax=Terrimonas alba TaxID=3349636 RepID=UPI0035F4640D